MKKILLSLTVLAGLLAACSDDDQAYAAIGLQGKWNLIEIHNPMVGQVTTIEEGTVTWSFNESNRKLTVEDPVADEGTLNGTYNYSIDPEENACTEALFIDTPQYDFDLDYGCITIDGDTLRLSKAHVDGGIHVFVKD